LVFPSEREGLPNAVIEAAASGVPSVGWDVTGVRDAISDGYSGVLVPPGDVAAFARATVALVDAVRVPGTQWPQQARSWAQRFDSERLTAAWLRLLAEPPIRATSQTA
jgi:glycosyltransferase involved in cell wall biosynthesis